MPITITVAELASAARIGSTAEETAEVTRLHGFASEAVTQHLGTAFADTPAAVVNEAVVRLAAYLYDQPHVGRGDGFANALRSSGAGRMLFPYRLHRAVSTVEAQVAAGALGTVGNPVTNVQIVAGQLVVSFADGTTDSNALPAGEGGMFSGTDQTARDAADAAQQAADSAHAVAAANLASISGLEPFAFSGNSDRVGASKLPMPPNTAEAAAGTATTIRSWTSALVRANVAGAVEPWSQLGNLDPIPPSKIASSIRGHRVFVQTGLPTGAQAGDVWIRDVTTSHPSLWEHDGTTWHLDYSFYGNRVHWKTAPHNVALNDPLANPGDILLQISPGSHELRLYTRLNTSSNPFWSFAGLVTGGGSGGTVTAGSLTPFISPWAFIGNTDDIPSSRFDFAVPTWLSDPTVDIPGKQAQLHDRGLGVRGEQRRTTDQQGARRSSPTRDGGRRADRYVVGRAIKVACHEPSGGRVDGDRSRLGSAAPVLHRSRPRPAGCGVHGDQ